MWSLGTCGMARGQVASRFRTRREERRILTSVRIRAHQQRVTSPKGSDLNRYGRYLVMMTLWPVR